MPWISQECTTGLWFLSFCEMLANMTLESVDLTVLLAVEKKPLKT